LANTPTETDDVSTARLEAFSDGVIAIIVTIMVLEFRPPGEATIAALLAVWPTFLSYALSFLIIAIYWVNHRHVVRYAARVSAALLWANMLVLFTISLIPFATAAPSASCCCQRSSTGRTRRIRSSRRPFAPSGSRG